MSHIQDSQSTSEAPPDTERALLFRSRHEIEARAAFSLDAIVTRENYRGIVGAYSLPDTDRVACQLLRKYERCNTPHGEGWVARTSDGTEGYIGGDCAAKYFGQRSAFALDRARANRELTVDDLLSRLAAAHADESIPVRTRAIIFDARHWLNALHNVRTRLPYDVAAKLASMAKTGRSDVPIRVRYEEPAEKPGDSPTVAWVPGRADPVQAVAA